MLNANLGQNEGGFMMIPSKNYCMALATQNSSDLVIASSVTADAIVYASTEWVDVLFKRRPSSQAGGFCFYFFFFFFVFLFCGGGAGAAEGEAVGLRLSSYLYIEQEPLDYFILIIIIT